MRNLSYIAFIRRVYSNYGNDKLTSVNGTPLTYDSNGNVLTYGDKSFTWSSGRNLAQIADGDNTYRYTYDENGIRTSKTVNGVTTYFNTKDGVILSQTDGTNTMYFQYDTTGTPLGFLYNGTQYFYLTNQMGDVIAITDADGNPFAQYKYDEWGAVTETANPPAEYRQIAEANPLRYRGYYYDAETGYYYLQSRYYDPQICRFINADVYDYIDKDIVTGLNLFIYCSNDSINYYDSDGYAKKKKSKTIDITYKLTMAMLNNSNNFYEYAKSQIDSALRSAVIKDDFSRINSAMRNIFKYFYNHSKTNGSWDLKNVWKLNKNNKYKYDNKTFKYDDVGNFHFGFVGYQLFPLKVLQAGAGAYQVKSGTSSFKYASSLFDDPRDSKKIKEGYNLAKNSQVSTIREYFTKKMKAYPKYVWKIMTL